MRSAALKALLIHTAEEAGDHPGPDAEFGWGLINAKRAAEYITRDIFNDDVISTSSISNGGTYERQIYSDGTEPIKVTVVWTDPPSVNFDCDGDDKAAPRLVNDLDLKISKGIIYKPWTLNPSNPPEAINTSENHFDNVEQVYIEKTTAGWYTIQIDHDGTLTNGSQNFSLIVTGDSEEPPFSLKGDKNKFLNELEALFPTGVNRVDWRLKGAINYIKGSLADAL